MKPKILTDIENKIDKNSMINDLTTGGADKVASAETVKTLNNNKSNKINPTTFIGNLLSIDGDDYQCYHIDSLDSVTNYPPNATPSAFVEFIPIHSIRKKLRWSSYGSSNKMYECEYTPSIQTLFTEWRDITTRQDLIANDIIKLIANKTLYVATTGSDTTGDGTNANPYKTIQKAIDTLSKNLGNNDVRVYIGAGTYAGFNIIGFRNGVLKIIGGTNLSEAISYNINSSINIYNCDLRRMDIHSINTASNIVVNNSDCVILDGVNISNTDKNSVGIIGQYDSNITIVRSNISNRIHGVVAELGSYISIWNTTGTGNDIAVYAGGTSGSSSIVTINESSLTGTKRYSQTYGGVIIENGVPISVNKQMEHKADTTKMSNRLTFEELTANKGFLIKTDLPFEYGCSFFINIKGNTYTSGVPIYTLLQGYIYNNTIYTSSAINLGACVPAINIFNLNNKICLWIDYDVYFTGLQVNAIYDIKERSNNFKNLVTEITIETKPTNITQEIVCVPKQVATTDKVDILLAPASGYTLVDNKSYKINNILFFDFVIKKSDGSILPENTIIGTVISDFSYKNNIPKWVECLLGTASSAGGTYHPIDIVLMIANGAIQIGKIGGVGAVQIQVNGSILI